MQDVTHDFDLFFTLGEPFYSAHVAKRSVTIQKRLLWKVTNSYGMLFSMGWFEMGMSISMKKDTRKTNVKHNNREFSEKEKKQNSHVDFSRSHENTYLVAKNLKELYKTEFEKAQTDYNDKQKRSDRKIKNYYEHVQQGKKTGNDFTSWR
jgi:hypothetical protein